MSSPIVRDFTSATRARLVTEIISFAEEERIRFTNERDELIRKLAAISADYEIEQVRMLWNIAEMVAQVKEDGLRNINGIFRAVNNADVEYVTRFESILNRLDAYLNTLTRLENLIDPSMPGACPIGAPFLFMEQLAGIGNGMMDYWVNQLMQVSEDGSGGLQFNWSMLEEWMQADPNEQSTAQMAALVFVYLSMEDPDDIARLITAGYYSLHCPDSVAYGNPHLIYEQTEMLRALTAAVTVVVEPLAMATVWADSSINDPVIDQYIRNMQVLHVMSEVAGTITTLPNQAMWNMVVEGEYSETLMRLTVSNNGVWYIQYAVYNEESAYGAPPQFALSRSTRLGRHGTLMLGTQNASRHARYHYINLVTDGSIAGLIASESGEAMRDMVIGAFFSSAVSNATRATLASAGVGVILNVIADYVEATEQLNAALSYLDEGTLYDAIADLGGRICFTSIGGVNVVHGINIRTGEAIVRTEGFLHTHNYEITAEQLHMIILNGDREAGARSIAGIGITTKRQQAIWQDFQYYIDPNGPSNVAYRRALGAVADDMRDEITNLFGSAYDVDSLVYGVGVAVAEWPLEILTYVIERFNNPNPATQAIT